jgi:hypothetical protein
MLKNGAYTTFPVHLPAYAYCACVRPDSYSVGTPGVALFYGMLILVWRWHSKSTGTGLLLFVAFVASVSSGTTVRDFVHPRGDSTFFCFCLQVKI